MEHFGRIYGARGLNFQDFHLSEKWIFLLKAELVGSLANQFPQLNKSLLWSSIEEALGRIHEWGSGDVEELRSAKSFSEELSPNINTGKHTIPCLVVPPAQKVDAAKFASTYPWRKSLLGMSLCVEACLASGRAAGPRTNASPTFASNLGPTHPTIQAKHHTTASEHSGKSSP